MTITRFAHGADTGPVTEQPSSYESARVVSGALAFQAGFDQQPTSHSTARHVVSHDGVAGGSVMSTRQSINGRDTVELQPGNPSSRTLITQAIQMGLVEEHAPGLYRDAAVRDTPAAVEEESNDSSADPGHGSFDPQDDAAFAEAIAPLPQSAYDVALASGVAAIAHGQGSFEDMAKGLAQSAGMEPAEATELVYAGYEHFERAVARGLAPLGLSGDRLQQFYESTYSSPQQLQEAIQRVTHARDVSGFKQMAAAWLAKNPGPEVEALRAAGFEIHMDRETGQALARRGQGSWVPAGQILKG